MQKIFIPLLLLLAFTTKAQLFTGTGGPVLNNGGQETVYSLSVTGLTQNLDSVHGLESVTINLVHPAVEEIHAFLASPSGIIVELTSVMSCSGANFSTTCFTHLVPNSVTVGAAPYNGTFLPVGNLGRFNTGKPGNGVWKLYVKDFITGVNTGNLVNWALNFTATPAKPLVVHSSNLPLVFINTNNQVLGDLDIITDIGIINNGPNRNNVTDPWNHFTGKAKCHIRGSSSKMFEKPNIKVELTDAVGITPQNVSLLGMPAESDWVLTANYADKTMMRNALTHYMFQQMGRYSPRYRYVEVFINGEYFGVYQLMEKVKRGNARVNIPKLDNTENSWPYISGGYIVQINRADDPGWYSLYNGVCVNPAKFYYQYDYPNPIDITVQQKNYIKAYLDSFETVMQSPSYAHPITGYKKYIEDNSFVDFFIMTEYGKNVDGYRLSTYLYKDDVFSGGKMHIGPMWDFDLAWHNCKFGNTNSTLFWQYQQPNDAYPIPTWWTQFMQDPVFQNKLNCRYRTLRLNTFGDPALHHFVDSLANLLNESQYRNFKQVPILGAYIYPNPQNQSGANFWTEINDLKQWITGRGAWLDANVPGACSNVGMPEVFVNKNLEVFPNPFSRSFTISVDEFKGARIQVELTDMLGQIVMHEEQTVTEESTGLVQVDNLESGTYILKVYCDGKNAFKKLVKL